jgi:hypothetical protein
MKPAPKADHKDGGDNDDDGDIHCENDDDDGDGDGDGRRNNILQVSATRAVFLIMLAMIAVMM